MKQPSKSDELAAQLKMGGLAERERELKHSALWMRVCALREREWRLVRIATGLLDAAERGEEGR